MNPRPWQLAVMGGAFGLIAAGSCARAIDGPHPGADRYALAFLVSGVLAGWPLVLLGFRLPRPRRQAWPSIRQALLLGVASWVVTYGGVLGFASIMNGPPVRKRAMMVLLIVLFVTSAVAAVATLGSAALLAVGIVRRIRNPSIREAAPVNGPEPH